MTSQSHAEDPRTRRHAREAADAERLLIERGPGGLITFAELEALPAAGWRAIRSRIERSPGEGYRIRGHE